MAKKITDWLVVLHKFFWVGVVGIFAFCFFLSPNQSKSYTEL